MKKHLVLMALMIVPVIVLSIASCGEPSQTSNDNDVYDELDMIATRPDTVLEDENDFYQVFTSRAYYDSTAFTTVWLLDKRDSSVIRVTDPAGMLESGEFKIEGSWDDWYMEEAMSLNDESRSILSPFRVNLVNNVRHPWKLALYCFGYGHNYSSLIVTENKPKYEELGYSGFVCRSKYENVVFFDQVEDYTDWSYGLVTYVVYDGNMKELRRQLTFLGLCAPDLRKDECKIPGIIERGKSVPVDAIGDSIRSHKVSVYNEKSSTSEDRKIIETKAENGDIISYLVDEERGKAIQLPTNDEFVVDNNVGFVFMSYKTYDDGKRYSVLRIIDGDGNLRYEIR